MAIILKANKVNLFVSSVLCVFWYHSPNVLDTLHMCNISWLRVNVWLNISVLSQLTSDLRRSKSVCLSPSRQVQSMNDVKLLKADVLRATGLLENRGQKFKFRKLFTENTKLIVDGRLVSRLRGYHPVPPRPRAAGPLCTAFSSARHLQRRSTSSDMGDFC
jgi:hypothetical protein